MPVTRTDSISQKPVNLGLACEASVSARVRRVSWDETQKKGK